MSVFMIIAIVFFVLSVLLLAVTITIFFTQNIAAVIGDLSGKTAQKQIQQIRSQGAAVVRTTNRKSSSQNNNSAFNNMLSNSEVNAGTELGREKKQSKKAQNLEKKPKQNVVSKAKNGTTVMGAGYIEKDTTVGNTSSSNEIINTEGETDVLKFKETEAETDILSTEAETSLLNETEASTGLLDETETPTGVLSDDVGTTILSDEIGTSVLSNDVNNESVIFEITSDETFTTTDTSID